MRFAVRAALVLGVLLPVLGTYRRGLGYWRVEFTTMFEDYLAGALLLGAFWAAVSGRAWAREGLMMTTSFVSQVEDTIREGSPEPGNPVVLSVKAILLGVGVWALASTLKSRHSALE